MQQSSSNNFPPFKAQGDGPGRMLQRFETRFNELRQVLRHIEPRALAQRCGAMFELTNGDGARLLLALFGRTITVTYPELAVLQSTPDGGLIPASGLDTAFILYYLATADGAALEDRWIAFSELPDGRFYNQAFQGYTGKDLAKTFGNDRAAFEFAALHQGGERRDLGDASFVFQALPRVPILAVQWLGDDEFQPTCQLLFDASASHYLPTDACAVLGSSLTRMLIKSVHL